MNLSPYEKLCTELIGGLPENRQGDNSTKRKPTGSCLAKKLGLRPETIYRWALIPGTNIRIIPAGVARRIDVATQGAVTAEEIREFAKRHKSGSAA